MRMSDALQGYDVMQNKMISILALEDPFCAPSEGQTCWEAAGLDAAAVSRRLAELIG